MKMSIYPVIAVSLLFLSCLKENNDNGNNSNTDTTPVISSISPLSGVVESTVTIYGSNFSATAASNTVKFNGTSASVLSASETQLSVTVPVGATSGPITVTVGSSTATSSSNFTVISSTAPSITSFSPESGEVGESVTIEGKNFSSVATENIITFNGSAATVTSASATKLVVKVPEGATTGAISVKVGEANATSSSLFTVLSSSTDIAVTFSGSSVTIINPYKDKGVAVNVTGADVVVISTMASTEFNCILSGSTTEGSVKIYSDYKFNLLLSSVSITNSDGPAINIQSSKQANIILQTGSSNKLSDGTTYSASTEDQKGTLFSEGQMIFSGAGTLEIASLSKHAICSDDYIQVDNGNITVTKSVADAIHANDYFLMNGGVLNLTSSADGIECESGYIEIRGGSLTVNCVDDGVVTTYSGTDAAITPYISITGGTIGITTSGEKGSAIKSESQTFINNTSAITLKVSGRASKGIKTGKDLTITDCNITVTTSGAAFYDSSEADISSSAGINCDGNLLISAGTITMTSSGSGGKGITVDGTITLNGGNITITTSGAVYKYTTSLTTEPKGIKSDGACTVNGAKLIISSNDDGIKSENSVVVNSGSVTITKSTEGIEAPKITLAGGSVSVVSSDDCLNGTYGNGGENNDGSLITLSGATVSLSATTGDALDSNGSISMTGGTVIVQGPQSSPEVAMDYNGTFTLSGGLLIASGPNSGNMIQNVSSSSTQYSVLVKFSSAVSAGTLISIQNSSGTTLLTYAPARTAYYIVYSSSSLQSGGSYKIYTGGSCTGATVTNGLYSGGTYSAGTQKGSFTLSSKVSTVTM